MRHHGGKRLQDGAVADLMLQRIARSPPTTPAHEKPPLKPGFIPVAPGNASPWTAQMPSRPAEPTAIDRSARWSGQTGT